MKLEGMGNKRSEIIIYFHGPPLLQGPFKEQAKKGGIVSNANRGISISSVFVKITPLGENPKSLVFLVVRLYPTVIQKKKKRR